MIFERLVKKTFGRLLSKFFRLCKQELVFHVFEKPSSKDVVFGVTDKRIEWRYTKFNFIAEGINIELVKDDVVCAATTYGNEQIIPVLRIKGENIITRITVND